MIGCEYAGKIMDGRTLDTDGAVWTMTGLDGWDSPDPLSTFVTATSRSGNVNTLSQHSGRPLTVKGTVECTSSAAARAARDWLKGIFNALVTYQTLVVNEDGQRRQISVLRTGKPRLPPVNEFAFDFELPLMATRPFFTAMTSTTVTLNNKQTVTVTNQGNYAATPVLTVTGGGSINLLQVESNRLLSTGSRPVPSGTVADFGARTLYASGGQNLYTALAATSQWWDLAPGVNTLTNSDPADSAGPVSLTFYDTWT